MKRLFILLALASCSTRSVTAPPDAPEIRRISDLEDARNANLPETWITSPDPGVRERAAVALGRIMDVEGIPRLARLARDPEPAVRRAALFAMGQMGLRPDGLTPDQAGGLLEIVSNSMRDPHEGNRAAAVEAMGKLAMEDAPKAAIPHFRDPSPRVRRQAASACFRWRRILRMRDPAAKPGDLPQESLDALCGAAGDSDGEVRWRAIHAILQTAARPAPPALERFLKDADPLARLFALMVVERLKVKELAEVAASRQDDAEAYVRQAAVRALAGVERSDLFNRKLLTDASHHVRESVTDLIQADGPELEALEKDESVAVRSAALLARVRITEEKALGHVDRALADKNPLIRAAAVKGAATLSKTALLLKAREDAEESVRAAALVLLADVPGPEAWHSIWQALTATGLAERAQAAEALAKRSEAEAVPAAIDCFKNSSGRQWVEVRETIVDGLAAKPPDATTPFLLEVAKTDPAPSVYQKAVAALRKRGVADLPPPRPRPEERTPYFNRRFTFNPKVQLETTKGTMVIECFGREAPVHVANFIGLVEKGFYDGLPWHRVVPNFVIQGGDPLGNGWGDAGWSVRAEVNAVPYERGTLGMPRSAGWDTGGCQLFITHLPTPHLDGFYTVFGRVVKGLEVIDRIEIGDVIVRASVSP